MIRLDLSDHWDEIEALMSKMRKKQQKRNREMQKALFQQKIAEFASDIDWWPLVVRKRGKKNDDKHRTS